MKTIFALIVFEILAFFTVLFYYESKRQEPPKWKTDITHIECVNDSLSQKLTEDSLRFEKALKQSKQILNQIKNIER